ncbi:MAG: signal recognition particle protein [Deltaproteobacteria bacterium]|jgi:signal recognition particle subunit SRP54|nr:signal recognition particle protein [Deltaproteobacteria bacterium]
MFERLTDKLNEVFKKITGQSVLSEKNIAEAMKEVRLALLEADVNYKVVKEFLMTVTHKAMGISVLKSLTPGQQVIKLVNEELIQIMGGAFQNLEFSGRPPHVIMLVGLQGSGKTTTAAKLASYLLKKGRQPYLTPADVTRPAAITQLTRLAEEIQVPYYPSIAGQKPTDIAKLSLAAASSQGRDVVILDTAGRLSIDQELMEELIQIRDATSCQEILLVADGMTGQEAVRIAVDFDQALNLSGVILTKMEGDARGGAALSIRAVTKKPLKFIGVGEKISAFEPFHPERAASLILGMGDILSLIEKAQEVIDQEESERLLGLLAKGEFTLDDFRKQMGSLRKIGTVESLLNMIPGMGKLKKLREATPNIDELKRVEAIIDSMTSQERFNHEIIDASRRRRIAKGSGTSIAEINQLLRNFTEIRKIMCQFGKKGNLQQGINELMRRISG